MHKHSAHLSVGNFVLSISSFYTLWLL